jgi:four helix bundle protein
MPTLGFDELRVYQCAEQLADQVWTIVRSWDALARDTLGKQLIRAVDSIGANVAEGCGRGTYRDNRRFVVIARGSLYETRHWLRRAFHRKLLNDTQINELKPLIDSLPRMLNAYLKSIGKPGCSRKSTTTDDVAGPAVDEGPMTND